jgi:hypothetical protein
MNAMHECERADRVVEAIVDGRWPDDAQGELRSHVAACRSCAELVEVATALHADAAQLVTGASVPTASAMWWRMQARQRAESARMAERPIAIAQMLGIASGLGAAAASLFVLIVWLGRPVHPGSAPVPLSETLTTAVERSIALVQSSLPIAMTVALSAILVPLVLYFAMVED